MEALIVIGMAITAVLLFWAVIGTAMLILAGWDAATRAYWKWYDYRQFTKHFDAIWEDSKLPPIDPSLPTRVTGFERDKDAWVLDQETLKRRDW